MIYFAAPLFNEHERVRNAELTQRIECHFKVFLPQRDGTLLTDHVRSGVSIEKAEMLVFSKDLAALDRSALVVSVLDGAVIDEGVSFEIGYAYARGVECVGIQTDARRQLPTGNNPMINQALSHCFSSDEAFLDWLTADFAEWLNDTKKYNDSNMKEKFV